MQGFTSGISMSERILLLAFPGKEINSSVSRLLLAVSLAENTGSWRCPLPY